MTVTTSLADTLLLARRGPTAEEAVAMKDHAPIVADVKL